MSCVVIYAEMFVVFLFLVFLQFNVLERDVYFIDSIRLASSYTHSRKIENVDLFSGC